MFGIASGVIMSISDNERVQLVRIICGWLYDAGGDAGKMMLDAYYQISSENDPHVRAVMLDLLESVRASYVSG